MDGIFKNIKILQLSYALNIDEGGAYVGTDTVLQQYGEMVVGDVLENFDELCDSEHIADRIAAYELLSSFKSQIDWLLVPA